MGVSYIPEVQQQPEPPLPCPGFEGFEKRLEVEFYAPSDSAGLRGIPRDEIDSMLSAAECTIVSELKNKHFDSYVLSESSLFVYPSKIVLKTCGTTQLLKAIPLLLAAASRRSLKPCRCKYTRGTFIFPAAQPAPYGNFSQEVMVLKSYFGHLGGGGKAFVMGDVSKMLNWHVYVAAAVDVNANVNDEDDANYTLEMCMTQLDTSAAAVFYKATTPTGAASRSAADMTLLSGIRNLLPHSDICDFAFEPCGYSMNSVEGEAHSTIHVTPEDGFSYASFETMGYGPRTVDLAALVEKVLGCFRPASFSVSLSATGQVNYRGAGSWGRPVSPRGYACTGTTRHELPGGCSVVYHTFTKVLADGSSAVAPLPLLVDRKGRTMRNGDKMELASFNPFLYGVQPVCERSGFGVPDFQVFESIGPTVEDLDSFMRKKILDTRREDAFYVLDLACVVKLWKLWQSALPRVMPFYAVKCNPDPQLLSLLAALGAGFDVASKAELAAVAKLDVPPRDIVFANPCKLPSHVTEAANLSVVYTTFDSEAELIKLKKYHPKAEVLLRIRADDCNARCPLGVKYGAEMDECKHLLELAKQLGIQVAGVAFHVGSGASDGSAFAQGISLAKVVFDMASLLGLPPLSLLDIGGGFVSDGGTGVSFSSAAYEINKALDEYFPKSSNVRIIAEPGRFFAEEAFSLAANIFGCRNRMRGGNRVAEYWVNDGIYGSMNCLLYDHASLTVRPLLVASEQRLMDSYSCSSSFSSPSMSPSSSDCDSGDEGGGGPGLIMDQLVYQSTIFGPTCDGLDTVMTGVWLPQLDCGDWLVFPRMGAYTKAAGSAFNGFSVDSISTFYVHSGVQPQ